MAWQLADMYYGGRMSMLSIHIEMAKENFSRV